MCKYTNPGKTQGSSLDKYSSKYYNPVSKYASKYKKKGNPMRLYLQSHHRRPISRRLPMPGQDPQAAVPRSWCPVCGGEIYQPHLTQCEHCRKEDDYV